MSPLRDGEQVQALRQIFVQNYCTDAQDRPKWREAQESACRLGRRHTT